MTNSIIEKSCHSCTDRENILERSDATKRSIYGAERIDMKGDSENTAMKKILKAPKWAAQAAIRGEIGISSMKTRIARSRLLYVRRIKTGNNQELKRILERVNKARKVVAKP